MRASIRTPEAVGDASEPDDDTGAGAGEKGPAAFYDPFRGAVFVDRALCEALPADALRGLVGHELVHVGQFRCDGVIDALRAVMRADREAQGTPEALGAHEALVRFVANLEGHARRIEEDHFAQHAAIAPVERLLSPLDVAALAEARRAQARAVVDRLEDPSHAGFLREAWLADKEQRYAVGARAYRARSVSGAPARAKPPAQA